VSEVAGRHEGSGYEGAAVLGAALATFFFPVVSLIAALLLHGGQPDPVKKKQLRTWAWISGAWLAVHVIIVVLAFVAFASLHPSP
jgi:hypothetical protein